jgi:hypothetical protein
MDAYVQEVRKLESNFSGLEVHHVLREHNVGADILSKLGSTRAQVPSGVFVQELKQPSIKSSPQVTIDVNPQQPDREVMVLGENWREVFIDFIRDQRVPAGIDAKSAEAARVFQRSKGFILVEGKLYRRGARSGVLMKCVTKEDGYDILREIHEGACGNYLLFLFLFPSLSFLPFGPSPAGPSPLSFFSSCSPARPFLSSLFSPLGPVHPARPKARVSPLSSFPRALFLFFWAAARPPA